MVDLFRRIAKLSNRATQDTAAYDAEEVKLKTYTELSNTLSQISSSATMAVRPTLEEIITNRAKYQERVQVDFKHLGHVWEDVFQLFVTGTVQSIEAKLKAQMDEMKKELGAYVEEVFSATASNSLYASSSKRKLSDDDVAMSNSNVSRSSADGDFAHKRRRLAQSLQTTPLGGTYPPGDGREGETRSTEPYGGTLQQLTEENERLKAVIRDQSAMLPGSNYSASWASSAEMEDDST
ncbi:hypothetical protein DENSPDRAFT_837128 [Dentipellis sp. KUC8613]|nr:hypothetical protein DENSPDRAFT_837128 [Dentipellis sp. KUC8613]